MRTNVLIPDSVRDINIHTVLCYQQNFIKIA